MYDPVTGQFVTIDRIEDDPNAYRYVRNNPLNAIDPSGQRKWTAREGGETLEADLVAVRGSVAVLQAPGEPLARPVKIAALSDQDHEYIRANPITDDAETGARTWVDASLKNYLRAVFVEVRDDNVFLRTSDDGREVRLPIKKLSAEDQAYVASKQAPLPAWRRTDDIEMKNEADKYVVKLLFDAAEYIPQSVPEGLPEDGRERFRPRSTVVRGGDIKYAFDSMLPLLREQMKEREWEAIDLLDFIVEQPSKMGWAMVPDWVKQAHWYATKHAGAVPQRLKPEPPPPAPKPPAPKPPVAKPQRAKPPAVRLETPKAGENWGKREFRQRIPLVKHPDMYSSPPRAHTFYVKNKWGTFTIRSYLTESKEKTKILTGGITAYRATGVMYRVTFTPKSPDLANDYRIILAASLKDATSNEAIEFAGEPGDEQPETTNGWAILANYGSLHFVGRTDAHKKLSLYASHKTHGLPRLLWPDAGYSGRENRRSDLGGYFGTPDKEDTMAQYDTGWGGRKKLFLQFIAVVEVVEGGTGPNAAKKGDTLGSAYWNYEIERVGGYPQSEGWINVTKDFMPGDGDIDWYVFEYLPPTKKEEWHWDAELGAKPTVSGGLSEKGLQLYRAAREAFVQNPEYRRFRPREER